MKITFRVSNRTAAAEKNKEHFHSLIKLVNVCGSAARHCTMPLALIVITILKNLERVDMNLGAD